MIEGIGLKVFEITEFNKIININKEKFINEIFTSEERKYCEKRNNGSLAVRFAAKIAWMKATGEPDIFNFLDIEIVNDELGKPNIILYGEALLFFNKMKLHESILSLSHSKNIATAFVLLQK